MILYLAGPMRGHRNFNAAVFDRFREEYIDKGNTVHCPIDIDRKNGIDHATMSDEEAEGMAESLLERNYEYIDKSNAVIVLPGWENSRGTLKEIIHASSKQMPIYDAVNFKQLQFSTVFYENKLKEAEEYWESYWSTVSDKEPDTEEVASDDGIHRFDTGSVRSSDCDDVAYHLISPAALRRLAETCREGEIKYSAYNWEKGQPVAEVLNHAIKHIYQFLSGDYGPGRTEDHLAHAFWNLMAAIHYEELNPEMMDGLRSPKPDDRQLPLFNEEDLPISEGGF